MVTMKNTTITPERKLVSLVKSITKSQAANNFDKLYEIAQSMYNDSKNKTFTVAMKSAYEKQAIRILQVIINFNYSFYKTM